MRGISLFIGGMNGSSSYFLFKIFWVFMSIKTTRCRPKNWYTKKLAPIKVSFVGKVYKVHQNLAIIGLSIGIKLT